jgi:hypothetical protein
LSTMRDREKKVERYFSAEMRKYYR